jgi:lambda family phage tail tape measure protein
MSDVIGRGVIEVSADSTKLKVGIEDAKRSIAGLGTTTAQTMGRSAKSIDNYVKSLQTQNATMGMSAREADRYRLTMRGATAAQLAAADAAHAQAEAQRQAVQQAEEAGARSEKIAQGMQIGIAAIGAAAIAGFVAFDHLVKGAADFSDLADKTGDSAENIASLAVAAGTAGIEMTAVADLAVKLSKNLVGVDDDSAAAGAAIKALGLDLADLKKMAAADRLEAVAKALDGFADGAVKGDVAMALLGKSGADALGFLKEIGQEGGRQVMLTNEQIAAADDYADSQAKLTAQIGLYAQSVATDLLPTMTEFKNAIVDITKDQANAATASALIKATLDGLVLVFQTLVLVGSDVAFTFNAVGTEIGAVAAQAVALAHLDIKGFRSISAAVTEDSERARAQLDKFQARILAINQPKPPGEAKPPAPAEAPKKTLKFNGAPDKSKKGEADKIASAQLALDVENIRKAGQAQIAAYANAEQVMQALRSAGLVDDKDYYDSKLGFIRLNTAAEEQALQAEIDRIEKENAVGKRKLDNQKKIVEAQAKIDQLRSQSVAAIEVNTIQEEAANRRIAQSYVDATKAAEQYIASIKRQDGRDIAGLGKGDKFRQEQSALGQMSDSKVGKVDALDTSLRNNQITQDQYDKYLQIATETYTAEVAAYNDRTAAIDAAQGDWVLGAQEAWSNYLTHAQDVAGQSSAAFTDAFEGMANGVSSSIAKTITHGDSLGESLANVAVSISENFIAAFIKIGIQKLLTDKVAAGAFAGTIAAQSQAMVAMAGLNAFASTAAIPLVGPAAAPAAAAAATLSAEVFAGLATAAATLSVASAAGGFDIPAGVNPLTQLHEKEMVLPAQHADTIRRLGQAGNESAAATSGAITQTYNIKIDGTTDMARNQQMVRSAIQQGNAELVEKLQRAGRI